MRHLMWLVQLCFLCHHIITIKSHGLMLSKGTTFQLCRHPTVKRVDGSHVIKNISKICCHHNDTHDSYVDIVGQATANNTLSDNGSVKILNIFKNILQQLQKSERESDFCDRMKSQQQGDLKPLARQRKEFVSQQHPRFSILQQLRLDEEKQKWQQQQLELQQQQQALRLQHNLQNNQDEGLGKAGSKNKRRRRRRRRRRRKRKRKKKKPAKDKKKRKRKKKPTSLLAQPAQILFASPTQKPHFQHTQHDDNHNTHHHTTTATITTAKPILHHPLIPVKKIKYILRKSTILKKKKKEYLNHLKHVLYPFVKFIAFFTIANPFTLAALLFSLALPVVFGFLGFISLSFLIKPALHLLFGIKHTLNTIKRRKLQQLRRRQRFRDSRRPITIHKHYYQQRPIASPSRPHRHHPPPPYVQHRLAIGRPQHQHPPQAQQVKFINPLLPDVRQKFKKHKYFIPDIKGHNDSFERF